MKRETKIPAKPTRQEEIKLRRTFYLPDWQFEQLIEEHCTLVLSRIIRWEKGEPEYAGIYGLKAVFKDTGKPCFGNFFLHYKSFVYQSSDIHNCIELIEIIKKEAEYKEYEHKVWTKKFSERQKKKKERAALKKISTTFKKRLKK